MAARNVAFLTGEAPTPLMAGAFAREILAVLVAGLESDGRGTPVDVVHS